MYHQCNKQEKETDWNKIVLKIFLRSAFSCIMKIVITKIIVDAVCKH